MDIENRRKVANYLKGRDITPLRFEGYESPANEAKDSPLKKIIERCIDLTTDYRSIDQYDDVETREDADRSVLDIWRHIRYYYPNISLLSVMRNMHKVTGLVGHYCPTIKRQVFNTKKNRPEYYFFDDMNEFGIPFEDWKRL